MKMMKNLLASVLAEIVATAIFCAAALQTFAIDGLKLSVQCPDVVLSWPSVEGETYIVQYRPSLDPSTPWVMLTNSLPAITGTNKTYFVHAGASPCPSGGGSMMVSAMFNSTTADSSAPDAAFFPSSPFQAVANGLDYFFITPPPMPPVKVNGLLVPWEQVYGARPPLKIHLSQATIENMLARLASQAATESAAPPAGPLGDGPQPDGNTGSQDPGFYEVVKVGAVLYGLTNGMTIGGVIKLPVEVGEPSGQLTTVTLEDSGSPVGSSIHVAPFERPVPLVVLDTTQMSNGVHNISVYAQCTDPGDGTEDGSQINYEATSPAVSVTVSNEISFPNWMPEFGELGNSLVVSAQSAHTNVDWYLDVYDSRFNYIGTLGGTTPDGNIYVLWNLVGPPPNNTLYTDNTFEFVLTTTIGNQTLASKVAPPIYRVTDPWNGPGDWVVVNQQAWNNFVGYDLLDTEADGFAQGPPVLGLTVRPTTSDGTAYRLHYGASDPNADSDWANFRSALYNNHSRNLFYLGHGSPQGMGRDQTTTNRSILASEIATVLRTIPAGLTNIHKYRFVLLDGCNTASGTLPDSFGINHKENVDGGYYSDNSLRPNAFAGWNNDVAAGFFNSVINVGHVNFFQHFLYEWTVNVSSVKQAFINAAHYPDVFNIDTTQMKVFGYWGLGINAFNR